jgi:hypothetical protein
VDGVQNDPQVRELANELANELQLPVERVEPVVSDSYRTLAQSRITSFLPILVRRQARARLIAESRGVA